jgi:hypothetical protein
MNLKSLINKSWYGSIGFINNDSDIELLGSYLLYNKKRKTKMARR